MSLRFGGVKRCSAACPLEAHLPVPLLSNQAAPKADYNLGTAAILPAEIPFTGDHRLYPLRVIERDVVVHDAWCPKTPRGMNGLFWPKRALTMSEIVNVENSKMGRRVPQCRGKR